MHYKIERVLFSNDGRMRLSHPNLIKTSVKMFDDVKRNLELQGYTVEILFHPEKKYTDVRIPKDAAMEIAEKDMEIERLKAEIAKLNSKVKEVNEPKKEEAKEAKEPEVKEAKEETPTEKEVVDDKTEEEEKEEKVETATTKKGGRPKKNA